LHEAPEELSQGIVFRYRQTFYALSYGMGGTDIDYRRPPLLYQGGEAGKLDGRPLRRRLLLGLGRLLLRRLRLVLRGTGSQKEGTNYYAEKTVGHVVEREPAMESNIAARGARISGMKVRPSPHLKIPCPDVSFLAAAGY
jgi:hypothetical protein